jgi:hypothetical protein
MRFLTDLSTQTRLFIVFGLLSLVAAFIAVTGIINVADFQVQVRSATWRESICRWLPPSSSGRQA